MTKVALFVTCIVDMLFPDVGEAALDILEGQGISVEFPEAQTCCGQPAFNAGFQADARPVAEHFLDVFGGYDAIVTPSGSCASMVRHYYPELFKGHARQAEAEAVAARTWELTQYLVDVLGVSRLGTSLRKPTRAAIHDACHGYRALGIGRQPRLLLSHVGNLSLVELPGHDQCCGFGGLFAIKMGQISAAMLNDKLANIQATDCDIIITGDASCAMHMNGGLSRSRSTKRVVHVAEVLAGRLT
ncbi:MAG: (Fe-S)-binding protein [Thermoflexales bacterium]|nr:(Fe-S)-binding protein [Thermoflexales bacterium]MDW8352301.1 (Fe-S)-binding protein [Anaerolineae bacterium]